MRSLAFFAFAAVAFAAVDGTVVNRTTGKPQPGAVVTILSVGAGGMKPAGSVITDREGKFHIDATIQGQAIIQVAHAGVSYTHQIQAAAASGHQLSVYDVTKKPAKAAHHMILLEPSGEQLNVTETFLFQNESNLTHHDADAGMLRFFLPKNAQPPSVMATGPGGMPVQRETKSRESGVYTVDFPIRPGETRFDVRYSMPFTSPGAFASKSYYGDIPVRIFVPNTVTLTGDGVKPLGAPDPRVQLYEVSGASFKVQVEGTGTVQVAGAQAGGDEETGPRIEQILPRVYDRKWWVLGSAGVALLCGFILLYRKGANARA